MHHLPKLPNFLGRAENLRRLRHIRIHLVLSLL